ncbi:MAG: mandelate racemase/muconate lactonizing enzyme family protein [SAR202 cluster bacterium]|nr:mandelate racemase/muconate lactonizing enzyme family protein [SAR202 cluster bacterium]
MKIKRVDAFAIRIPDGMHPNGDTTVDEYEGYSIAKDKWTSIYSKHHETALVRIETDDGIVGWGEGQAPVAPRVVKTIVDDLCSPVLVGADPFDVEYLWYRLYSAMRERGHGTGFYVDALAAVDIALYDIIGKTVNKPIYHILGGRYREKILVYAGIGTNNPSAAAESASEHADAGYRALKLHLRSSNCDILEIVAATRDQVGTDIELMVDIHGTRDVSEAIELGRGLEALDVRWLEAVTLAEDVHGHAEIARALDMQVATGEWLRTSWEWRQWIEYRAFDVAMPDIARTGLSEGKRIAALCDTYNLPIAPHLGGGGTIAVAASIHYALAVPNFQILEHMHTAHETRSRIAKIYPSPKDGYFLPSDSPGLGVEVNEDAVIRFSI